MSVLVDQNISWMNMKIFSNIKMWISSEWGNWKQKQNRQWLEHWYHTKKMAGVNLVYLENQIFVKHKWLHLLASKGNFRY